MGPPFARVMVVVAGSPADSAGLKQGDSMTKFGSVTKVSRSIHLYSRFTISTTGQLHGPEEHLGRGGVQPGPRRGGGGGAGGARHEAAAGAPPLGRRRHHRLQDQARGGGRLGGR